MRSTVFPNLDEQEPDLFDRFRLEERERDFLRKMTQIRHEKPELFAQIQKAVKELK